MLVFTQTLIYRFFPPKITKKLEKMIWCSLGKGQTIDKGQTMYPWETSSTDTWNGQNMHITNIN